MKLGPFPRQVHCSTRNLPFSLGHLDPPLGKVHCSPRKLPFFLGHLSRPKGTFLSPCASFYRGTSFIPFGTFLLFESFISFHRELTLFPMATCLELTFSLIFPKEVAFQRQLTLKFYLNGLYIFFIHFVCWQK